MLPFGNVPDDDTEAPAKRTEDIAAATPPRARRFSLGRVLLLVFLFVLVAGILYFVEELIVERRVVAACDRISDLVKAAPGGHLFQSDVQTTIRFAPSRPMYAVYGQGQEEYLYNSIHDTYTIRVTYWDMDDVGKPYVVRVEMGTRWKF